MVPKIKHGTLIKQKAAEIFQVLSTSEGWNAWFTDATVIDNENEMITLVWYNCGPNNLTDVDRGKIVERIPEKKFSFEWSPARGLTTTVSFELEETIKGTYVKVIEDGYDLNHLDALVECAAGWGEALTLLKFYMEKGIGKLD